MNPPTFPGIATLLGYQEAGPGAGFWLFNLEVPIPGHPAGSTVSERTLNAYLADCSDCDSAPFLPR